MTNYIWRFSEGEDFCITLPQPSQKPVLILPAHAAIEDMAIVDVTFEAEGGSYLTDFIVEWQGNNELCFILPTTQKKGNPQGAVHTIRMKTVRTFQKNNILTFGEPVWVDEAPVIPINRQEDVLVDFLHPRFYDDAVWTVQTDLPQGEAGFKKDWMYASIWYLQKPGRQHRIAVSRPLKIDISGYQAVSLFTATDIRAMLTVTAEIDGHTVVLFDKRKGLGGGDEMRAEMTGNTMTALTFILEQVGDITESIDVKVATDMRWLAAEKKGTDLHDAAEVTGTPLIPSALQEDKEAILPIGLLIDKQELAQLKHRIKTSAVLQKLLAEFIAECDSHLNYIPEPFVGRWLPADLANQGVERKVSPCHEMKTWGSMMVYGSFCYAITGQLKYGQMARRALLCTLRCEEWQGGFCTRVPAGMYGYRAPFVETHTAESAAICYDFIYGLLSEAERREAEDALFEKALKRCDMFLRLNSEGYLLKSNQGAVYTTGAVMSALVARKSHPEAQPMLDWVIAWFPRMMNYYFKADGGTNEGPGYWEYTMQYAATALVAISRYLKVDVREYAPPQLPKTMDYMLHIRSLARESLAFLPVGDNNEKAGYSLMGCSFLFFAKFYGDKGALWLWHEYCNPPHPPGDLIFAKEVCGACAPAGLLNFLFFVEDCPESPDLEKVKRFTSCDRVLLRTGGHYGDKLVYFEGGPQSFDHAHFDKGEFMFEAYGERFAADPGTIKYQDPAHRFFLSTSYHNLVTIGGKDQDYGDPSQAVKLQQLTVTGSFEHIQADLANSYKELIQYDRHLVFVRPEYLVVFDIVESSVAGLEWNFHSCAALEQNDLDNGLIQWKGKAGMTMAVGCDCGLKALRADSGAFVDEGQIITHNLRLAPRQKGKKLQVAALLIPYESEDKKPTVTVTEEDGATRFTVTGPWGADTIQADWNKQSLHLEHGKESLQI